MVHALEQIHRLLEPGGVLIDIHSAPEAPLYEVRAGDTVLYTEPEPGFSPDSNLAAQRALDDVALRGLFALEETRSLDFVIVADSVAELRTLQNELYAYAGADEPSEDETRLLTRLEEALEAAGPGARVGTREVGIACRLRAGAPTHRKVVRQREGGT